MKWSRNPGVWVGLVLATWAVGCAGGDTPSAPTAPVVADTFSGTIGPGGVGLHTFAVTAAGQVDIRVTSVAPSSTQTLGVALGTWSGSACTRLVANGNVRQGLVALSGNATSGNFCVEVYDSGSIAADTTVDYVMEVFHT